jgi:hypothetical protein
LPDPSFGPASAHAGVGVGSLREGLAELGARGVAWLVAVAGLGAGDAAWLAAEGGIGAGGVAWLVVVGGVGAGDAAWLAAEGGIGAGGLAWLGEVAGVGAGSLKEGRAALDAGGAWLAGEAVAPGTDESANAIGDNETNAAVAIAMDEA